jgi:hypothetical protein
MNGKGGRMKRVGIGFLLSLLMLGLVACLRLAPPSLDTAATLTFVISRNGSTYTAQSSSSSFSGTLKFVVQSAVTELNAVDGGTIRFQAGNFNLGASWFELEFVTDVIFEGQGIDVTVLLNNSSAATDTEVFDCTGCDRITIRDLTVSASGPFRSTSDALDFDGGDYIVIERVKITSSRGRGIVFDGKGEAGLDTANHNVVRDCVISGLPSHGIELLASSFNLIEDCSISNVGGSGIVINKASSLATQPNKQSNDNVIASNHIENVGNDGIRINSGNRNIIRNNTVLNSSDDVSGRDGIRIDSSNGIVCNDNLVELNTATDNQAVKTQKYGLKINSAACHRTVVGTNNFAGNLIGSIFNAGTNTSFDGSLDTQAPSIPANLSVTSEPERLRLNWTASSDNVGVTGYEIQRNGSVLATVGNLTSYTDTLVDGGLTYTYRIRARDAAANWSGLSASVSGTPASVTTFTFTPVADTYVYIDNPTNNYGASTALNVDGSPLKHILFKFNLSGLGSSQIVSAKLWLYCTNSSPFGGSFHRVNNTSWNESTVNWNTAPGANSGAFTSLGGVQSGNWYEADLSSQVSGDGLISFKIISTNEDSAYYSSKEGELNFRPKLVVKTTP